MFEHFGWILATFTLVPAQLTFLEKTPPEDVAILKRSTVVRIETGCEGTYSYRESRDKVSDYTVSTSYTGTGYFVSPDGYIVTNAHLVSQEACKSGLMAKLVGEIKNRNPDEVSNEEKDQIKANRTEKSFKQSIQRVYLANGKFKDYDIRDYDVKEVAEMPKSDKPDNDIYGGKDVAVIKIDGISAAPTLQFGNSEDIREESAVKVIGYPGIGDISSQSFRKASVTSGKVSAVKDKNDVKVFQVDVSVAPGSSGSPVLNNKGEVVGMIAFYNKNFQSGDRIPFAVTTNTILEYVRKSGAPIAQESTTDRFFREGLEFFARGDYESAKLKFEQVKQVFPQHSEADEYITKSQTRWNEVRDEDRKKAPIVWSLIGIGGLALLGGAYWMLRKRSSAVYPQTDISSAVSEPISTRVENSKITNFFRRGSTIVSPQRSLELKNQQGQTRRFYLQKSQHRLGRDRRWADLYLPDEGWEVVSRQHAKLVQEGENYRVFDLSSANKLLVNGTPIDEAGYLLQNSDELNIGHHPSAQVTVTYFNSVQPRPKSSTSSES